MYAAIGALCGAMGSGGAIVCQVKAEQKNLKGENGI